MNATMDIAAARHALSAAVEACARLGIEDAAVGRWQHLLKEPPPYVVDSRGALAEWAWPGLVTADDHRHVSHLYPVWPLHEITPDGTPELAAAAHRSLVLAGTRTSRRTGACTGAVRGPAEGRGPCPGEPGQDPRQRHGVPVADDLAQPGAGHLQRGRGTGDPRGARRVAGRLPPRRRRGAARAAPSWARGRISGVRCRNRVVVAELAWDQERFFVRSCRPAIRRRRRVCRCGARGRSGRSAVASRCDWWPVRRCASNWCWRPTTGEVSVPVGADQHGGGEHGA